MAILNQTQLVAASNATYIDNTSGSITPTAVRTFNDSFISSSIVASVTSSMSVASASVAGTASFALNFNPSATASYALQALNANNASTADTATFASSANTANSANTAVTASNATTANTAAFATTASFALNFNPAATASYALFAETASYALNVPTASVSASYALSASYASNADTATTSQTASYVLNAVSASRATSALNADTATTAVSTTSASYASNAELLDNLNFTAFVLTSSFTPFSSSVSDRLTAAPTLAGNNTFTGNNIFGNVTASNALITNATVQNLTVIYETSSVIYSSGSNQFGDAANDVQTLWGTVDVKSGPLLVTGSARITGSLTMAGLSPISVSHVKANDVQGVEILTNTGTTVATFGAGGGTGVTVVGQVNATSFSGSGTNISGIVAAQTASYVNTLIQNVVITGSLITSGTFSISNAGGPDFQVTNTGTLIGNAMTDVHATTGSFSITGSSTFNGSVNGQVISSSIASSTSSLNFSLGNFYTSLVSGSTNFNITNPKRGQTVNLLLSTAGVASASFSSNVKQVSGSAYTPTSGSGKNDILTFISFDGTSVYLANVKNLI
jgi:hypothetical protein